MNSNGVTRGLVVLLYTSVAAWCQTPVVSSLVNSASFQPTLGGSGTIGTIFGTNLATGIAAASSIPLPLQLGHTSVTVGGIAAPLLYVSPTQINLQMPAEGSIVVSTPAGTSSPFDPYTATPNTWYAGGIFSMDGSGCGQGAVLNIGADGELSVNSPINSASPGNWIAIYGTGLAEFLSPPIGVAAPSDPVIASESGAGVGAEFDFRQ